MQKENSMYWFRWIAVLPGALISGFLMTFPLHWMLYFTLANGETISGVNIDPIEFFLYPFVIAITFILVGFEIAPKHKFKVSVVLAVIWMIAFFVLSFFISGQLSQIPTRGAFAFLGLFLGLFIAWEKSKSDFNNNGLNDETYEHAKQTVLKNEEASVALLMREDKLSFSSSVKILEKMKKDGFIEKSTCDNTKDNEGENIIKEKFKPKNEYSCVSVITDDSIIMHNLYLSAIKIALECDKGSPGLFKKRLQISYALAYKLYELLIKDGVLIHHPGYTIDTAPCDVNHELGKRLANLA